MHKMLCLFENINWIIFGCFLIICLMNSSHKSWCNHKIIFHVESKVKFEIVLRVFWLCNFLYLVYVFIIYYTYNQISFGINISVMKSNDNNAWIGSNYVFSSYSEILSIRELFDNLNISVYTHSKWNILDWFLR